MKKLVLIATVLFLCSFAAEKPKPKYEAFFACSYANTVTLDVQQFMALLNQPLCAKDSAQRIVKVESYEITYAERGLFQDSTGLPIITTDYTNDKCKGDSITTYWKKIFEERAYKGDTIFFEKVSIKDSSNKYMYCKSIKVILSDKSER